MKLSIIIPTFNSSKVIGRALDSIVAQTFGDWEVLVMDGASKDNTGEIVKSYNDERIKLYSEPDKGIYDAMNKGIKKSQGEWLYFLGSDDWLYDKDVLAYFFSDNDFSKYDVVYGEVDAPQLGNENRGEWTYANVCSNICSNRCHQAIFYKRIIFEKFGFYNIKYKVWADYDLNLKWFLDIGTKSKYENRIVSHYSDGGFSADIRDEIFLQDKVGLIFWKAHKKFNNKEFYVIIDNLAYQSKQRHDFIKYYLLNFIILYYKIKFIFIK